MECGLPLPAKPYGNDPSQAPVLLSAFLFTRNTRKQYEVRQIVNIIINFYLEVYLISMLMLKKKLVQIVHVIEKINIKNDKDKIFISLFKVGGASWIKNSKC